MSRLIVSVCLVLALTSASFGYVIGNWENGNLEGWSADTEGTAYIEITPGMTNTLGPTNTLGDNALLISYNGNYWQLDYAFGAWKPTFSAGAYLAFDFTMFASDQAGWMDFDEKLSINSDGPSGYMELYPKVHDRYGAQGITGHDFGSWTGDFARTYVTDLSSYDSTGATWMIIRISGQGWPMAAAYIDNVRITPEPATLALLGLGGLALIRRKK